MRQPTNEIPRRVSADAILQASEAIAAIAILLTLGIVLSAIVNGG